MKAIVSVLIALSVLAGIAAPASALDTNVLSGRTFRRTGPPSPLTKTVDRGSERCRDWACAPQRLLSGAQVAALNYHLQIGQS